MILDKNGGLILRSSLPYRRKKAAEFSRCSTQRAGAILERLVATIATETACNRNGEKLLKTLASQKSEQIRESNTKKLREEQKRIISTAYKFVLCTV